MLELKLVCKITFYTLDVEESKFLKPNFSLKS